MTHRPLRDNELFEIRLDRLVNKWSGSLEVNYHRGGRGMQSFLTFLYVCAAAVTQENSKFLLWYDKIHKCDSIETEENFRFQLK